jgi:hypothetical protein
MPSKPTSHNPRTHTCDPYGFAMRNPGAAKEGNSLKFKAMATSRSRDELNFGKIHPSILVEELALQI